MNTQLKLISSAFALLLAFSDLSNAQIITNFGTNASNDGVGWTYNPATSQLSGVEAVGSYLYGTPLSLSIAGSTQLSLTATVTTDPLSTFTITLEDNAAVLATGSFSWSSFIGGSTVVVNLTPQNPGFNFSNIVGWTLDSGSSGNAIGATLTSLSAVPEPATWALLAGSLTITTLLRRRRRA